MITTRGNRAHTKLIHQLFDCVVTLFQEPKLCFFPYRGISITVPIVLVPKVLILQTWLKYILLPFQASFPVRSKEPGNKGWGTHSNLPWTWNLDTNGACSQTKELKKKSYLLLCEHSQVDQHLLAKVWKTVTDTIGSISPQQLFSMPLSGLQH